MTDFGISAELEVGYYSMTTTNLKGTMSWMAPELLHTTPGTKVVNKCIYFTINIVAFQKFSCKSDIFAMGCVIYFVLSNGSHPFGSRYDEAHQNIKEKAQKIDEQPMVEWPAAKDLIKSMIVDARDSRY